MKCVINIYYRKGRSRLQIFFWEIFGYISIAWSNITEPPSVVLIPEVNILPYTWGDILY